MTAERNLGARLRSASRIEPDRLPRLRLVGNEWADAAQALLTADRGEGLTVEYQGASAFERPADGGPTPAVLLVGHAANWPQPPLAMADDGFKDLVAELLLGGDGSMPAPRGRPATELDLRVSRAALEQVLHAGNAALAPVMEVALEAGRFVGEGAAERLDGLTADVTQRFTRLSFRLSFGRCESAVEIAVPDQVLALARRKLDHLPEPPVPAADQNWAREIEEGLLDAEMALTALLDEKATTLGEIAGFRVGQTIVLNAGVDSPIVIECEDQRLFRGRMGRSRDSYLVRIDEKIDPTEEFIDDILAD